MIKLSLILLLLPLTGRAQTADPGKWITVTHTQFTIEYPSSWTADSTGQQGTQYLFFSPPESTEDRFRDNVNVMVQDLTGYNLDLSAFAVLSQDQIKSMVPNAQIIESTAVTSGANRFHRIIYTGDHGSYHLKFEQYYFVRGNTAYVVTFTSEQDKFDQYKQTGERILNSFSLRTTATR